MFTILHTQTNQKQILTIINKIENINFEDQKILDHKMLLVRYQRKTCIFQKVSIYKIRKLLKNTAKLFGLKNTEIYRSQARLGQVRSAHKMLLVRFTRRQNASFRK